MLLGSYASVNLHDPETYIASVVMLFSSYPLWAGEAAVRIAPIDAKYAPPSIGVLRPILEDQVRTHRYAKQWDRAADDQLKRLDPPRRERPSYDELKAKYGQNWGINNSEQQSTKSPEQCRDELIAQIGQEAFDAIPDRGFTSTEWQELRAPTNSEAAE